MDEKKNRFLKLAKSIGQIVLLGILYFIFIKMTGWKIPCIFYELTGKYCPGCGVTRMCLALVQLDFASAMRNNLLVFCLLGPGLIYGGIKSFFYIKNGTVRQSLLEKICIVLIFVLTIAFAVVRNTSYGAFLQPV